MMDNLAAHLSAEPIATLRAAGVEPHFRPTYSPDYAPIERAFYVLKAHLRRDQTPITPVNIYARIAAAMQAITAQKCDNFYRNCGYP
jgi:transposase